MENHNNRTNKEIFRTRRYLIWEHTTRNMEEELSKAKKTFQGLNDTIKISNVGVTGLLRHGKRSSTLRRIQWKNQRGFPPHWERKGMPNKREITEPQADPMRNDPCLNTSWSSSLQLSIKEYSETAMKGELNRGTPIRFTVDFSEQALQARWDWDDILQIITRKTLSA